MHLQCQSSGPAGVIICRPSCRWTIIQSSPASKSAAPKRSLKRQQFENCHQMPVRHDAMKSHEIIIVNWSPFLCVSIQGESEDTNSTGHKGAALNVAGKGPDRGFISVAAGVVTIYHHIICAIWIYKWIYSTMHRKCRECRGCSDSVSVLLQNRPSASQSLEL